MTPHPEDNRIYFFTGTYQLFPRELPLGAEVELDLGCGSGGFSVELARRYPDRKVLAADVMVGRLRKLVRQRDRMKLENLEILRTEARCLVARMLPDSSLDRVHLLCPDPWPKDRHRGHRLLTSDFTAQLHRVLKPEGIFHFSSDDEYYCDAVKRVISSSGLFKPDPEGIADILGIKSGFELRWLSAGKPVWHLAFRRLPLPPPGSGH